MPEIVFDYEPLEVHRPFHASQALKKCMFGAVGSGKSYALCSEAIARCLEMPGLRGLLARRFTTDLRDTTETVFFDILPPELYAAGKPARLGGHYESFTFPNGSKILFRGVEDWTKHKSLNLGWAGYDEADELDEETIRGMDTRMRQRDLTREAKALGYRHQIDRRQVCFATNPSGHNFLYDMFVDPAKAWAGTEWFRSTSFDNPYLPGEFLQTMMEMPQPWIRRYVLCQFDDFAGAIYPDWTWETHVVPVRREPWPSGTVFFMGLDPGMAAPTAGLWVALDPEKQRLVAISEYQEADRAIKEHAAAFRKRESELRLARVNWRVADPALDTRDQATNMSRRDMYSREGFSFDLGAKSHDVRIPALGELIFRVQFVAQENCPMLHEQITRYRWADLTPGQRSKGVEHTEKVFKANDHLVDTAQYIAGRYRMPLKSKPKERDLTPQQEFSEEVRRSIRDQLQRKQGPQPTRPGVIL